MEIYVGPILAGGAFSIPLTEMLYFYDIKSYSKFTSLVSKSVLTAILELIIPVFLGNCVSLKLKVKSQTSARKLERQKARTSKKFR